MGVTKPLKNLRHFNARELLGGGVYVATAAERLGHADGEVTMLRFYATGTGTGTGTADQRAAEQLSQYLQLHRNGYETDAEETTAPTRKTEPLRI